MIVTDMFTQFIALLKDAVSITVELEDVAFDPLTKNVKAGKARVKIGGSNDSV